MPPYKDSRKKSQIITFRYNPDEYRRKFGKFASDEVKPRVAKITLIMSRKPRIMKPSTNVHIQKLDQFSLSPGNSAQNTMAEAQWISEANRIADTLNTYRKLSKLIQLRKKTILKNQRKGQGRGRGKRGPKLKQATPKPVKAPSQPIESKDTSPLASDSEREKESIANYELERSSNVSLPKQIDQKVTISITDRVGRGSETSSVESS